MAGKRIERDDLIDIPGYKEGIQDARRTYKAFLDEAIELTAELKKGITQTIAELNQLRAANASGGMNTAQQNEAVERARALKQQYNDQKSAVDGLIKTQQQHQQVNESLIAKQNQLLAQYEAIQGATGREVAQRKRLATEIAANQIQLDKLAKSQKQNAAATKEVVGQYNILQRELTENRQALRSLSDAFDVNTGKINRNNAEAVRLATNISKADAALKKMDAGMGQYGRNVGNYQSALQGLQGGALGLLATMGTLGIALGLVASSGSKFLDSASRYEQIRGGLKGVTKDAQDLQHTQEQLQVTADKLGISYEVLAETFKGIKVGTEGTKLEGIEAERIFKAFTTRLAELHTPAEKSERALKALSDMLSKGTIMAEEIKSQLGDAMPGAFKLFADALGVSTKELNNMLKRGEVLAEDTLPKVADQLERTFSGTAVENVDKLTGATERLTNQTGLLVDEFNQKAGITSFFASIKNGLADTALGMRELIKSNEWGTFFNAMLGGEAANARLDEVIARKKVVDDFSTMTPGMRRARIDLLTEKIGNTTDEAARKRYEETLRALRKKQFEIELAERKSAGAKSAAQEKEMHEQRVARVIDNAKKLTLAERQELIRRYEQETKDREAYNKKYADTASTDKLQFNQREIGYNKEFIAGLKAVNKELEKKDAADAKRDAKSAERIAKQRQNERERIARETLQNNLGIASAGTNEQLAQAQQNFEAGLTTEQQYIVERLHITTEGITKRRALLHKAGKDETDDMAKLNAEQAKANADYLKSKNDLQERAYRDALSKTKDAMTSDQRLVETGLQERLTVLEDAYNKEEAAIKVAVARKQLTEEQGENRLHNLKLTYIGDIQRATLSAADTVEQRAKARIDELRAQGKTEEQIAQAIALEKEAIDKAEADRKDADAKRDKERSGEIADKEIADAKRVAQQKEQLSDLIWQAAGQAMSSYFEIGKGFRDAELSSLEKQKTRELEVVGDNAEAKAAIEKRFDQETKALKRRQAEADKAAAAFQIGLSTAQAAIKAYAVGGPFAAPIAFAISAIGALQLAAVLAAPIPEFFKGTRDAPEGPAWVGERGYELIESKKSGKSEYRLAAEKQITYLNKHDRVYTHEETKRMLRTNADLVQDVRSAPGGSLYVPPVVSGGASEEQVYRAVARALNEMTWEKTSFDENGVRRYTEKQNNRTEWLNKRMSYPKSGNG